MRYINSKITRPSVNNNASRILFQFIFLFSLIEYSPAKYDAYTYPAWAEALGWMMALLSILIIPVVMIYKINKEDEEDSLLEVHALSTLQPRVSGRCSIHQY